MARLQKRGRQEEKPVTLVSLVHTVSSIRVPVSFPTPSLTYSHFMTTMRSGLVMRNIITGTETFLYWLVQAHTTRGLHHLSLFPR